MQRHSMGRAPNYTVAALVTLGINLFCLLFAVWTIFGIAYALLVAWLADRLLIWIGRRRQRAQG